MVWYILKNKVPVKVDDFMEFAIWSQDRSNMIVEQTEIGNIKISTVFLGIDHSYIGGEPILFETMIFGGKHDQYQQRYRFHNEAVKGHKHACNKVLKTFSIDVEGLQKVVIEYLN